MTKPTVADCLVEADFRGVDSHGVSRLAIYVKRIERGGFDPVGRVEVDRRGAVAHVDGGNALGQVVARAASLGMNPIADTSPAGRHPAIGNPQGPEELAALDGLAAAKGLPPLLRLGAPG